MGQDIRLPVFEFLALECGIFIQIFPQSCVCLFGRTGVATSLLVHGLRHCRALDAGQRFNDAGKEVVAGSGASREVPGVGGIPGSRPGDAGSVAESAGCAVSFRQACVMSSSVACQGFNSEVRQRILAEAGPARSDPRLTSKDAVKSNDVRDAGNPA